MLIYCKTLVQSENNDTLIQQLSSCRNSQGELVCFCPYRWSLWEFQFLAALPVLPTLMSRNACSRKNGEFDKILPRLLAKAVNMVNLAKLAMQWRKWQI